MWSKGTQSCLRGTSLSIMQVERLLSVYKVTVLLSTWSTVRVSRYNKLNETCNSPWLLLKICFHHTYKHVVVVFRVQYVHVWTLCAEGRLKGTVLLFLAHLTVGWLAFFLRGRFSDGWQQKWKKYSDIFLSKSSNTTVQTHSVTSKSLLSTEVFASKYTYLSHSVRSDCLDINTSYLYLYYLLTSGHKFEAFAEVQII